MTLISGQNIWLGAILILAVPVIKIAPSLFMAIYNGRSLRTSLKEMAEVQEASTEFKDGENPAIWNSSQQYLKAVLHPKFQKRLAYKIDKQIGKSMPRLYRLSPHRATIAVNTGSYVLAIIVAYGGILIYARAANLPDLPAQATVFILGFGVLVQFIAGNYFETKLMLTWYAPKYEYLKLNALDEFNQKFNLNFPYIELNGPGFSMYEKQENGTLKPNGKYP